MEEKIPKKRGRKKLIDKQIVKNTEPPDNNCNPGAENIPKKRGRKKKWETTPFKTNYIFENQDSIKFKEDKNKNIDREICEAYNKYFSSLYENGVKLS